MGEPLFILYRLTLISLSYHCSYDIIPSKRWWSHLNHQGKPAKCHAAKALSPSDGLNLRSASYTTPASAR